MIPLDTLLRSVEERCNKATPGPWFMCAKHRTQVVTKECGESPCEECGREMHERVFHGRIGGISVDYPDGEFIAHSRTDLPLLVKIVWEQQGALKLLADFGHVGEDGKIDVCCEMSKIAIEAIARIESLVNEQG